MCLTEVLVYPCGHTATLVHDSYEAVYDEDGDAFEQMAEKTVHMSQACVGCRLAAGNELPRLEDAETEVEGVWMR